MTKDVAIEAIKGEQMGKHASTDFLCISFSSTDIIGHSFGPNSLETADCYARLDRDIEALLKFIDEYAGKNNVLVFLTADHGVALNPLFAKDKHLAGSFTSTDSVLQNLNNYLSSVFGTGKWINSMSSQQIYLNKKMIATSKFSEESVALKVRDYLIAQPGTLCVCAPDYGINNCAPLFKIQS